MFFLNVRFFLLVNSAVILAQPPTKCECVKKYLCDDAKGEIITDGYGIISFRGGGCKNKDEVCCKLPKDSSEETVVSPDEEDYPQKPYIDESWYAMAYDDTTEKKEDQTTTTTSTTTERRTTTMRDVTERHQLTSTTQRAFPVNVTERYGVVEEESSEDLGNSFFICGTREASITEDKIQGDRDDTWTQQGDFPWTLLVKYELPKDEGGRGEQVLVCGASLIAPAVAITAAHSIDRKIPKNLIIRAGEWDLGYEEESIQPEEIRVKRVIKHPKYDERPIQYDIALLVLERPFVHNAAVNTICLPPDNKPIDWSKCYATGWGASGPADERRDNAILRKAKLPLVSHAECQSLLRKTELGKRYRLHPSFLCAGGDGEMDTCKGDGGGPLACESPDPPHNYHLIGVTSWGLDCGRTDVPGAYTNVLYASQWIKTTLGQLLRENAIDSY